MSLLSKIREEKKKAKQNSVIDCSSDNSAVTAMISPTKVICGGLSDLKNSCAGMKNDHEDNILLVQSLPNSTSPGSLSTPNNTLFPKEFCLLRPLYTEINKFKLRNDLGLFYIPDVIDLTNEEHLTDTILSLNDWVTLKTRKLQCWGHNEPKFDGKLPEWLSKYAEFISDIAGFSAAVKMNHCLINHYSAGQGILHHTDGPKYVNKVAILSLGSTVVMSFRPRLSPDRIGLDFAGDAFSVILEPRSLLIFENEIYDHYLHGITSSFSDEILDETFCLNVKESKYNPGDEVSYYNLKD